MGVKQYIGARYVPKFFENSATGDSTWAEGTSYEPLMIVAWNESLYTSKYYVPANVGAPNLNPEYWVLTGRYSSQVGELTDRVDMLEATRVKHYDTALAMIDDGELETGDFCYTGGYYNKYDTGAGIYIIGESGEILLDNGLYATVVTADDANIICYGADPNGVIDSTDAISKCLLKNSNVYIPSGTFLISNVLNACGKHIYGEGKLKVANESNLLSVLDITGSFDNTVIEGIEIDCSGEACTGIFGRGRGVTFEGNSVDIKNVRCYNTDNYWFVSDTYGCAGIFIEGVIGNVLVKGCDIHDIKRTLNIDYSIASVGVAIASDGIIEISNNKIYNIYSTTGTLDSDGIHMYNYRDNTNDAATGIIVANEIWNCRTRGIKIQKPNCIVNGNKFYIENNFITADDILAIDNQVGGCTIINNRTELSGNSSRHIRCVVGSGIYNTIENNICVTASNLGTGIEVAQTDSTYVAGTCEVKVKNNTIKAGRRCFAFRFGRICDIIKFIIDSNEFAVTDTWIWSDSTTTGADLSDVLHLFSLNNINVLNTVGILYPNLNISNWVFMNNAGISTANNGVVDWNKIRVYEGQMKGDALNKPSQLNRTSFVKIVAEYGNTLDAIIANPTDGIVMVTFERS